MFGWLKRFRRERAPTSEWAATIHAETITIHDIKGDVRSIAKDDISSVIIETNDSGPWCDDVWWILFGLDNALAGAFPQGIDGEKDVVNYLMTLPGFDEAEMIKAMGSTANAVFILWRRTEADDASTGSA